MGSKEIKPIVLLRPTIKVLIVEYRLKTFYVAKKFASTAPICSGLPTNHQASSILQVGPESIFYYTYSLACLFLDLTEIALLSPFSAPAMNSVDLV